MKEVVAYLDKVADVLEEEGFIEAALYTDICSNTIEKCAVDDRSYKELFQDEIKNVFLGILNTIQGHLKLIYNQDPRIQARINAIYLANKGSVRPLIDNARKDMNMSEQKIDAIIKYFK